MCKKIHRGGNAEQYHADKKYKEAVAVAVKACAADTMVESIAIHEELAATARRVLGPAYPLTTSIQDTFAQARERLASFDK